MYGGATILGVALAIFFYFASSPSASKRDIEELTKEIQELREENLVSSLPSPDQLPSEYPIEIKNKVAQLEQLEKAGVEMNSKAYFERGLELFNKGVYKVAIEELTKAVGLEKNYGDAYYVLGSCNFNIGNHDKATEDYKLALEIAKSRGDVKLEASVLNGLGLIYRDYNRMDDAIKAHEQSLKNMFKLKSRLVRLDH